MPAICVHEIMAQSNVVAKHVPVVELKGDAYNRGLQHGRQLKNEIAAVFKKWKINIARNTGRDPDTLLNEFLKATNFIPAIEKNIPSIIDEMHGIADGSGQSYHDVYAFQLVDEFWIYLDSVRNISDHHCSAIGVAATGRHPAYIAQNIDLENYMQGFQVLLHVAAQANEPEQYIVTCAGLVALAGMNGNGIGLCLNALMELKASKDGLPVAFIIRKVLMAVTSNEAIHFLKAVEHASGQNYVLGTIDSVFDFEASSGKVVRYNPDSSNTSIVYHTNHALANHDVKDWYRGYHERVIAGETKKGNSEVRFATLEMHLAKSSQDISPELIKLTLRSKENASNPVCRTYREGAGGFTFSSVLFTLGGRRSIQLTLGSPDQSDYVEYFFGNNKD